MLARQGVTDGFRTRDNWSHNPVLYQLSYGHRKAGREDTGGWRQRKPWLGRAGRRREVYGWEPIVTSST